VENKIEKIKYGVLKTGITVLFFLLAMRATAPEVKVAVIFISEPVNPYDRLIKAIVNVECSGDYLAYNVKEEAVGPFQIRPIRILDYNQRTGKKYKIENCFDFDVSKEIFLYYAEVIGYPDYEKIARRWNGSGKTTLEYWKKVKNNL
jgi:hypothetical protein